jgi:single-strand DNA-binding protein
MAINKVILTGRLTRDPELRHTSSGKSVANFSIAVDNGYGENKTTDFINCVAWNKTAEFVENYFSKGRMIALVGRISTRTWEGEDGRKNYVTEVVVSEVSFCDSKSDGQNNTEDSPTMPSDDEFVVLPDNDDLPF